MSLILFPVTFWLRQLVKIKDFLDTNTHLNMGIGVKSLLTLSILILSQSCIAANKYDITSVKNRQEIYKKIPVKKKKIKIFLANEERELLEETIGARIQVGKYCINQLQHNIKGERAWSYIENNLFQISSEVESPIKAVCLKKQADFIYEYSYEVENAAEYAGLSVFPFLLTFGVVPIVDVKKYIVSLKIKSRKGKILKEYDDIIFKQTGFISTALLPFITVIKRKPVEDMVVTEIVIDKMIETFPDLKSLKK